MWHKFIPVPDWIPQLLNFDAITIGCFVFIKKSWEGHPVLRQHELKHVEQFYKLPVLNFFLYLLWPTYRLESECESYAINVKMKGEWSLPFYSKFIYENYFLKLFFDFSEVESALRNEYNKIKAK